MKLSERLSFDVYNMHAKAGKWVFRAPECSLKRGVYDDDDYDLDHGEKEQHWPGDMLPPKGLPQGRPPDDNLFLIEYIYSDISVFNRIF